VETTGHWYWIIDEMERTGPSSAPCQSPRIEKAHGQAQQARYAGCRGLAILLHNGTQNPADGFTHPPDCGSGFRRSAGPKARSIYGWTGYGETWNSETCAAGQPVLAVKTSLMFRAVVPAGRVKLTVLPVAGLNVYPAEGTTVV